MHNHQSHYSICGLECGKNYEDKRSHTSLLVQERMALLVAEQVASQAFEEELYT